MNIMYGSIPYMTVGIYTVNVKDNIMRRKTKVNPIDRNWGIAIFVLDIFMAMACIGFLF